MDIDVTYLIFKGFRLYLLKIIDLYYRKGVTYKTAKHNDDKLVMDTLNEAIINKKKMCMDLSFILIKDYEYKASVNQMVLLFLWIEKVH